MVEPDATDVTLEEMSPSYGWRFYWLTVLVLQLLALLLAYVFLQLSLYERRCAFTDEQREAAVEGWRSNARWLMVLAMTLFGIWIPNRFALTWKLIVTAVNLLMTGFILLHLHFLLKDPESELPD